MAASAGNNRFQERTQRARRHNHALVTLARRVWDDNCTLSTAVAQICRIAADTLDVARVNVWHVDLQRGELHCIHAYEREGDRFDPPGYDDIVLKLDSEYGELLEDIRVIDIADVGTDPVSTSDQGLRTYLERHDIQSLLDAPIRSEGVLLGVVCHEHVGSARVWTPEDQAFAGSIGDYIAVAYEITRRREIVSWALSGLFQYHGAATINPDDARRLVEERFWHTCLNGLRWFDHRYHCDLDVYAHPFEHADGCARIAHEGIDLFLYRQEDMSRLETRFAGFLDLPQFSLGHRNVGEDKGYSGFYRSVLREFRLPGNLLSTLYDTPFMRHFYSDQEREVAYARWVRRG